MSKLRVGLLFGGRSVEHEVSIASATSIFGALDSKRYELTLIAIDPAGRWHMAPPSLPLADALEGAEVLLPASPSESTLVSAGGMPIGPASQEAGPSGLATKIDVVFPIVHGRGGEDGSLQGLLELAGVPYVGSGVLSSALQMDKDMSKRLLDAAGVPVVPWITFTSDQLAPERIPDLAHRAEERLGMPLFVKPANSGSSVGIHLAENPEQLVDAIEDALRYDTKVLVEKAMDAREIEVAVIGNEEPQASLPGEIRTRARFYDYEAKYADDATELLIPAELSHEDTQRIRELALRAYRVLDAAGLARVDFLMDASDGSLFVNELNSLPGFTSGSMFPLLWEATGLSYTALLDRLIELALERHARVSQLETRHDVQE